MSTVPDSPNPSAPLSARLARAVPTGLFRPLARPSAPVYVDCADRLARGADEGGQISHDDALLLIREVLGANPLVPLADDEGAALGDPRQRAGQFFNKLIEAGWLTERRVSLDERWVLVTPQLRRILRMLRDLAENDVADLRDFAATIRSVCATLLAEGALDPGRLEPEEFRQTVKELLDRVDRATEQMHAVESLILRHEREQRTSESAAETLERFLVGFHQGEHMVCYDALQAGGLLPRLQMARTVVQRAMAEPMVKERLAKGIEAQRGTSQTESYLEAERLLLALDRGLGSIPVKQRIIDGRMADFSRLSSQRYRYQTEMRGRRAEQVKDVFRAVDAAHAGRRFADLANEPGLELLSAEVSLRFGSDALYRPRKARPAVNLGVEAPPNPGDVVDAQELIRRRNLYAVTPQRAGRWVERRLPKAGMELSTADLRLGTEDDLLDLLAVLAFERSTGSAAQRSVRWKVHLEREFRGLEPEKIPLDRVGGRRIERLRIERLA